jgi:hypothetical protein
MPGSTPKAGTVAKKVGQGAQPGRPAVVAYNKMPRLLDDKGKVAGFNLVAHRFMPSSMERAEDLMKGAMPTNLTPQVMKNVLANKHRREH